MCGPGLRAVQGIECKTVLTLVDDINDLFHCHTKACEAVSRVLDKGFKKDDVLVDYTGGTKNMSVALALAAISHGFPFSYIGGNERTKNGVGTVVDGAEKVFSSVNPWDFLALDERNKITLLFNKAQYRGAANLLEELVEKSSRKSTVLKKIGFIVEGYYYWDLFWHQKASERFKRARIDDLLDDDDKKVQKFADATKKLLPLLDCILKSGRMASQAYILDMYANAERRYLKAALMMRFCEFIALLK